MIGITDSFINGIFELTQKELPKSAIRQAKICLIDYLGATYAGSKILREKNELFLSYASAIDDAVSIIGYNKRSSIYNAALINGMCSHISELDDGVRQGSMHVGAPIISALLPLAELKNISGEDLIKGIVVGYEAAIRLASSIQPSHRNKGYHTTGTCGTIGVTIAAAAALGFSRQQMKDALSASVTSASGLLNVTKGISELKPYNVGQATVSGLMAAFVAQAGFVGPDDVLAGEWGFLKMMSDKINIENLVFYPGDKLRIETVYLKPFASCRHSHPAIEAVLELKKQNIIDISQVKEVKVYTYKLAVGGHDHTVIDGMTSAKMSTPFSIAVALQIGKVGIQEFSTKYLNDQNLLNLAKRVIVILDESLNSLVPNQRPAIVEITTKNNVVFSKRVDLAKGEPENPLTEFEVKDKFISLALFGEKSQEESNNLFETVWDIENKLDYFIKCL